MFIIINSKRPAIYEQRPSIELPSAPHWVSPGSLLSMPASSFSLLSMAPLPRTSPGKSPANFPQVKKNLQTHVIVIPHQFAPKQIVVNCEFLIKFIRILITFAPYVLYIIFSR